MACEKCAQAIADKKRFCPGCGANLSNETANEQSKEKVTEMKEKLVKNTDGKKSWNFTEKYLGIFGNKKKVVEHTLTLDGNKISHVAETKTMSGTMYDRDDFSIENVYSVRAHYSFARNMAAVILCALCAAILLICSIAGFASGNDEGTFTAVIWLIVAAVFVVIAFFIYKKIKPAFFLEINAYIPKATLTGTSYGYGNYVSNTSNLSANVFKGPLSILLLPITLIVKLFSVFKGKYRFEMDEATGREIVDAMSEYLVKK